MADRDAVTPGRAAYEAYSAAMPRLECQPWDEISSDLQAVMETVAVAAIRARYREYLDECDHLRAERDQAVADRDDYAARLKATDQRWATLAAERDKLAAQLAVVINDLERIVTTYSVRPIHDIAADALVSMSEPS